MRCGTSTTRSSTRTATRWSEDIAQAVAAAEMFRPGADAARRALAAWRRSLFDLFDRVELLALPTLPMFPPRIDGLDAESLMPTVVGITAHVPSTPRGTPCTAQPVPVRGSPLPASLQLVGPLGAEELLLTSARRVEDAAQA